ncbi:hypothetical protein SEA_HONK_66 [Microbacterium phage Honk]|uniref:Uncharacterized protein n=1 Tax=Microbacterium phage Honk TaxID=2836095 RepID=A0A8F3EA14_9CAUD|nr:hypothetical protein SEA_HONK_66 [Microbacterium phage Honk]
MAVYPTTPRFPLLPLDERLSFERLMARLDWDRIPLPPVPEAPDLSAFECGDRRKYQRGCRCAPCKAANADAVRKARQKKKATEAAKPAPVRDDYRKAA